MIGIQTTFEIPDWIEQRLKSGEYIRVGGVIRETKTKQIVAMLREVVPDISQPLSLLTQASSAASFLNLGVSILNLAVSVIGFTLIRKHLKDIENQIENQFAQVQDNINDLHIKFDISTYANFSAALDLASDATMTLNTENRRNMATLAINRFLEAQHIFNDYINIFYDKNINFTDKYILSLSLAYLARARCYLELEEIHLAISCLNEGAKVLHCHVQKYVKNLLISQPIARVVLTERVAPKAIGTNFVILDVVGSSLESSVELYRLASICKWLEPEFNKISDDQSILFDAQQRNLVKFHIHGIGTAVCNLVQVQHDIIASSVGIASVGTALVAATSAFPILTVPVALGTVAGIAIQALQHDSQGEEANSSVEELAREKTDNHTKNQINTDNLLKVIENIEQIIETYNRFEAYLTELQVMQQLGISFQNWLQLSQQTKAQEYEIERMYIILSQPLDLK